MEPKLIHSFTSSFISIDRFNIHYVHQGDGIPLILLHGGGTWLYSFRHNIGELSRHFSVYAIDLPGHGYSKPMAGQIHYNMDTVLSTLTVFMEKLGISATHLAGHSWGGGWAIHFAARFPSRVSKMILIDSSGLNRHEHLLWEIMKIPIIGEVLLKFINTQAIRKGLNDSFYDKTRVTPEMVSRILVPLKIREIRKAQLSYARNSDWRRTEKCLTHIRRPVLILWGRHDRYIHLKYGQRMADLMADARLVILENCGHSSHEECPDTVNRLMVEFLK
jgi:pimeloyl-ACP methyl ester carboxylesterase